MTHARIPAVSVAVVRGERLLLVRRGRAPGTGLYAFPGGRMEAGETAEEAARRELMEETGVTAGGLVRLRDLPIDGREGHAFLLTVFAGRHLAGEPVAGDDADAAGFFSLDQIAALPLAGSVLEISAELLGGGARA